MVFHAARALPGVSDKWQVFFHPVGGNKKGVYLLPVISFSSLKNPFFLSEFIPQSTGTL